MPYYMFLGIGVNGAVEKGTYRWWVWTGTE